MLHLSPRYSHVTLVSRYLFSQLLDYFHLTIIWMIHYHIKHRLYMP